MLFLLHPSLIPHPLSHPKGGQPCAKVLPQADQGRHAGAGDSPQDQPQCETKKGGGTDFEPTNCAGSECLCMGDRQCSSVFFGGSHRIGAMTSVKAVMSVKSAPYGQR